MGAEGRMAKRAAFRQRRRGPVREGEEVALRKRPGVGIAWGVPGWEMGMKRGRSLFSMVLQGGIGRGMVATWLAAVDADDNSGCGQRGSDHPNLLDSVCRKGSTHPNLLDSVCAKGSTHPNLLDSVCRKGSTHPNLLDSVCAKGSTHPNLLDSVSPRNPTSSRHFRTSAWGSSMTSTRYSREFA